MRALAVLILLAGCAPDAVGERVGRSLYDASVNTGHALAVAGDRTGQAIQGVGAGLRGAVNPPPSTPVQAPALPPPYAPDGFGAPVEATPLPSAGHTGSMGY